LKLPSRFRDGVGSRAFGAVMFGPGVAVHLGELVTRCRSLRIRTAPLSPVVLVGLDNPAHNRMADNILPRKAHERDTLDVLERMLRF